MAKYWVWNAAIALCTGFIAASCQTQDTAVSGQSSINAPTSDQPPTATLAADQTTGGDRTVVKIDSGRVRGAVTGNVIKFLGIPYAAPPIGNLRWREPQPVKAWSGIRTTDKFGAECMQTDNVPKSEDCLFINVWRPANAPSQPLPVMVWIYGGALAHGQTSLYPADALASQGVIVVSMNYRMGRLGFFAHPALAKEAPNDVIGNYGFMDQRAALQWVQRNIAAFGGDPKQVTIFGESAGGGSVMTHLTSPMSRGLFQRAILQSPGVPTARAKVIPLTERAEAERMAVEYARSVGVKGDGAAALKALRALPAEKLVEGASAKQVLDGMSAGKPVIGVAGAIRDGRLIALTPEATFAAKRQAMVPVIVGANDADLGIGQASTKEELFALFGPYASEARKLYDPQGNQPLEQLRAQVLADKTLVEPARHLADEMARAGQPIWLYRFAYVFEKVQGKEPGTAHGFEIPFTFNIPEAITPLMAAKYKDLNFEVTPRDRAMGILASAYWVQFGKTGDPNGGNRPTWAQHDPKVNRLMQFTNTGVTVGPDPLKSRLDLWQKVWNRSR